MFIIRLLVYFFLDVFMKCNWKAIQLRNACFTNVKVGRGRSLNNKRAAVGNLN